MLGREHLRDGVHLLIATLYASLSITVCAGAHVTYAGTLFGPPVRTALDPMEPSFPMFRVSELQFPYVACIVAILSTSAFVAFANVIVWPELHTLHPDIVRMYENMLTTPLLVCVLAFIIGVVVDVELFMLAMLAFISTCTSHTSDPITVALSVVSTILVWTVLLYVHLENIGLMYVSATFWSGFCTSIAPFFTRVVVTSYDGTWWSASLVECMHICIAIINRVGLASIALRTAR